jgi:hypothetical protein
MARSFASTSELLRRISGATQPWVAPKRRILADEMDAVAVARGD